MCRLCKEGGQAGAKTPAYLYMSLVYNEKYNYTCDRNALWSDTTQPFCTWGDRSTTKVNDDPAIAGGYINNAGTWGGPFLICPYVPGGTGTVEEAIQAARQTGVGNTPIPFSQFTTIEAFPNSVFYIAGGGLLNALSGVTPVVADILPIIDNSDVSSDKEFVEKLLALIGYEEGDVTEESDPFTPGGTTGDDETDPEGGDGDFENAEVTVDPPALPSLSAVTSGFIAAYMPTFAQLQSLGDYLWSDLFSLDTFKKLFNDPMQAILGLSLVPVTPPTAGGTVVIGNVSTGITMPRVLQQFVTVDCGSVTLPEYWGGYLDYSPYTKVEIYLPYIGVRPLDTDEVMGRTLHVVYHVDVLSGACVCFIQCDNTIRYHYVGQCGASIPITANDWTRVVNGAVSIATALGVGVATLGAGAAAGGVTAASMAGAGALVGGVASQVLASKPRVEHSGSLAGMGGLLGIQFPYIMIQRPRQAVPTQQNAFTGYPSFIKRTLSTVTGYTQVTGVHLTGLSCTDEEKKEIQAYLETGVIL